MRTNSRSLKHVSNSITRSEKTLRNAYVLHFAFSRIATESSFRYDVDAPQIIPHAVDYFTGKALEYDAEDMDDDDDDDDEEDDDAFEDEDDVCTLSFLRIV